MAKNSKNKTKQPKSKVKIPQSWIVKATGASIQMVKAVKSGDRKSTGKKGEQIQLAETLFEQEASKLITEVKRLVKL